MDMRDGMSGQLNHLAVFEYMKLLDLQPFEKLEILTKIREIEMVVRARRDELAEQEKKKQERKSSNKERSHGRTPNPKIRRKR